MADDAYSLRIDLTSESGVSTYFPAREKPKPMYQVPVTAYDRREGIVTYTLPVPSRVHLQAGTAKVRENAPPDGPVLATVVDRRPRPEGSVVEPWQGLDASGSLLVPELPNFLMSVACFPLPEASILTVGNRNTTFYDYARTRKGKSLLPAVHGTGHAGHQGLNALEDVSPNLALALDPAPAARLTVAIPGGYPEFVKLGGRLEVFLDGRLILQKPAGTPPLKLDLPREVAAATPGPHILAVNWSTDRGPTGVGALRYQVPASTQAMEVRP